MINQPEERPLSIGSAVQFTHKGKTIHGHLLQRQGRRRFAKVVDTAEQTWNVPESMLKHSRGAQRATIITRHDNARADYRVGDEVTFTSPDGPRRGEIVKFNPKSAKVRCEETGWNVSISNSLSSRHGELDHVPAVGDPTDIVQLGTGHHVAAGEGQRRVALQRRVAASLVVGGQTPGATPRGLKPGGSERYREFETHSLQAASAAKLRRRRNGETSW